MVVSRESSGHEINLDRRPRRQRRDANGGTRRVRALEMALAHGIHPGNSSSPPRTAGEKGPAGGAVSSLVKASLAMLRPPRRPID